MAKSSVVLFVWISIHNLKVLSVDLFDANVSRQQVSHLFCVGVTGNRQQYLSVDLSAYTACKCVLRAHIASVQPSLLCATIQRELFSSLLNPFVTLMLPSPVAGLSRERDLHTSV